MYFNSRQQMCIRCYNSPSLFVSGLSVRPFCECDNQVVLLHMVTYGMSFPGNSRGTERSFMAQNDFSIHVPHTGTLHRRFTILIYIKKQDSPVTLSSGQAKSVQDGCFWHFVFSLMPTPLIKNWIHDICALDQQFFRLGSNSIEFKGL